MRIAMLLESDGPGGAERMLLQLACALKGAGHHVLPIGPAGGCGWLAEQFHNAGFETSVFHLRSSLDGRCVRELVKIFKEHQVDLVHSHEFTMAVYGYVAARAAGIPNVITMHGGTYFTSSWKRRGALKWACRNSKSTVTVSEASRLFLSSSLNLPQDDIHVVHNGIDFTAGERAPLRKELGIPDHETLIVSNGNLYPVKGHMVLLRALVELANTIPELRWHAAFAGRGDEELNLRAFAQENGIAGRVHLLGYRSDVSNVLAAADIVAIPSLSEGLPLALIEAMFAAKAVVASQIGGIPEIVRHEHEALLTKPGDHLELAEHLRYLIQNPLSRDRIGQAAREHATAHLGAQKMANAYEQIYVGAQAGEATLGEAVQ